MKILHFFYVFGGICGIEIYYDTDVDFYTTGRERHVKIFWFGN